MAKVPSTAPSDSLSSSSRSPYFPSPGSTTRAAGSPNLPAGSTSAGVLVSDPDRLGISQTQCDRALRHARATLAVAESARAPITLLGLGLTPTRPRLHAGPNSDWVLTRLEDDPLFQAGDFPIPRKARRHLTRLNRSGVHLDAVIVAHEIPKSLAPSLLSLSPGAGPVELDPTTLPKLITHPGPARSTRRFAATAGEVAGTVGSLAAGALSVVAAAPLALGDLLDPVIFGAQHVDSSGRASVIFELIRWEW